MSFDGWAIQPQSGPTFGTRRRARDARARTRLRAAGHGEVPLALADAHAECRAPDLLPGAVITSKEQLSDFFYLLSARVT